MQSEIHPRTMFLGAAAALFIVALWIAFGNDHFQGGPNSIAANVVVGLTALGFALSGGLSLLGAAIVDAREARDERRKETMAGMLNE